MSKLLRIRKIPFPAALPLHLDGSCPIFQTEDNNMRHNVHSSVCLWKSKAIRTLSSSKASFISSNMDSFVYDIEHTILIEEMNASI